MVQIHYLRQEVHLSQAVPFLVEFCLVPLGQAELLSGPVGHHAADGEGRSGAGRRCVAAVQYPDMGTELKRVEFTLFTSISNLFPSPDSKTKSPMRSPSRFMACALTPAGPLVTSDRLMPGTKRRNSLTERPMKMEF